MKRQVAMVMSMVVVLLAWAGLTAGIISDWLEEPELRQSGLLVAEAPDDEEPPDPPDSSKDPEVPTGGPGGKYS